MKGVFITGTGTGVGKTFVTAALTRELRRRGRSALALKPIACGDRTDAEVFAAANEEQLTLNQINPLTLAAPLSPFAACVVEDKPFDSNYLQQQMHALFQSRSGPFLIEGVGGWLVPITQHYWVRDWARELNLPVLIVSSATLGMLNHTLLTIDSVRASGCSLSGIVINHYPPSNETDLAATTNPAILAELTDVPIFNFHHPDDLQNLPPWLDFGL